MIPSSYAPCQLIRGVLAWAFQDLMKSNWPHRKFFCAMAFPCHWGKMIYDLFSNNSQHALCAGPSCQQTLGITIPQYFLLPPTFTVFLLLPVSVEPNWERLPQDLKWLICTCACLVIGTREEMVARLKSCEWQSSSGAGFSGRLAGSAHLGLQADGEGWGLHNTRQSHMSPNHTEPLESP